MHEHIIELLDQRRLKEALVQLQAFAVELEDWQLNADIESLSTTYNYMLQYAAQGVNDPERGKMYCHLWRRAYELADNWPTRQTSSKPDNAELDILPTPPAGKCNTLHIRCKNCK